MLGILAYKRKKLGSKVSGKVTQFVFICSIVAVLFLPQYLSVQATIVVVILTAFLLVDIQLSKQDYFLLANPIVVYIGLISYSLYLWHWVVLVISRWTIGTHWWSVPIQLGVITLLAFVSYRYVERPLRHARWLSSRKNIIKFATFSTVGFGLLLFPLLTRNSNLLYLGEVVSIAQTKYTALSRNLECGPQQISGRKQNQIIETIGNSHSLDIIPMLKLIADKCNLTLISQKHPDYIVIPSGNGKDIGKLDAVLADLSKGDILILSSRNRYLYSIPYLNGSGDKWIDHKSEKEKYGFGLTTWLSELDSVIECGHVI